MRQCVGWGWCVRVCLGECSLILCKMPIAHGKHRRRKPKTLIPVEVSSGVGRGGAATWVAAARQPCRVRNKTLEHFARLYFSEGAVNVWHSILHDLMHVWFMQGNLVEGSCGVNLHVNFKIFPSRGSHLLGRTQLVYKTHAHHSAFPKFT